MANDSILFEGDTDYGHYEVADVVYAGRRARVLYSGAHQAAQSGLALDDEPELLFDYNERFMELARGLNPSAVLVIGAGAFTWPRAFQRAFPRALLDVVEIDGKLLDLARQYFDFKPERRTKVHTQDGLEFLKSTTQTYDFIVVDVFVHAEVPPAFQTPEAARLLARHLLPQGVLAQNIIAAYHGERSTSLRRQLTAFQKEFSNLQLFPAGRQSSLWLPQNFVLTAQKSSRDLQPFLRFGMLEIPAML